VSWYRSVNGRYHSVNGRYHSVNDRYHSVNDRYHRVNGTSKVSMIPKKCQWYTQSGNRTSKTKTSEVSEGTILKFFRSLRALGKISDTRLLNMKFSITCSTKCSAHNKLVIGICRPHMLSTPDVNIYYAR
jgi:hypothetical protein